MISAAASTNSMICVPISSITETLSVTAGSVAIAAVIGEDCGMDFLAMDG
jgi:hypothetical protein